jgi:hypothetical protein
LVFVADWRGSFGNDLIWVSTEQFARRKFPLQPCFYLWHEG